MVSSQSSQSSRHAGHALSRLAFPPNDDEPPTAQPFSRLRFFRLSQTLSDTCRHPILLKDSFNLASQQVSTTLHLDPLDRSISFPLGRIMSDSEDMRELNVEDRDGETPEQKKRRVQRACECPRLTALGLAGKERAERGSEGGMRSRTSSGPSFASPRPLFAHPLCCVLSDHR